MKKYILGAIIAFSVLATPAFTQAAGLTSSQIQSILGLLSAFGADQSVIDNVSSVLNGRNSAEATYNGKFCYDFKEDLTIGNTGPSMNALNSIFNLESITAEDQYKSSTFDETTAARVVQFQTKYGISKTGYVGPITRAKLNSLYGCSQPVSPTPIICPQDFKICSDGTGVGRTGPNCSFPACPVVAPTPTQSTSYSITGITGNQSNYSVGSTLAFEVKGVEQNGTAASSDKGYNVQAYIYPASDTNFSNYITPNPSYSYNGTYDSVSGYWKVQMNTPSTPGSYNLRVVLYCSASGSTCYNANGHGIESIKILPFTITAATTAVQADTTSLTASCTGTYVGDKLGSDAIGRVAQLGYKIDWNGSATGGDAPYSYVWSGNPLSGKKSGEETTPSLSTGTGGPASFGTFVGMLKVTDASGRVANATCTVKVPPPNPELLPGRVTPLTVFVNVVGGPAKPSDFPITVVNNLNLDSRMLSAASRNPEYYLAGSATGAQVKLLQSPNPIYSTYSVTVIPTGFSIPSTPADVIALSNSNISKNYTLSQSGNCTGPTPYPDQISVCTIPRELGGVPCKQSTFDATDGQLPLCSSLDSRAYCSGPFPIPSYSCTITATYASSTACTNGATNYPTCTFSCNRPSSLYNYTRAFFNTDVADCYVTAAKYTNVTYKCDASVGVVNGNKTYNPIPGTACSSTTGIRGKVLKDDNGNGVADAGEIYIRDASSPACKNPSYAQSGISINYDYAKTGISINYGYGANGSTSLNQCSPSTGDAIYTVSPIQDSIYSVSVTVPNGWEATAQTDYNINVLKDAETVVLFFMRPITVSTRSGVNGTASALNALNSATQTQDQSQSSFTYTWISDLQIGSIGADVSALQTALTKEGVYAGEITGGFYNQTYYAVQVFQEKYGIKVTGYVGLLTREKLNSLY